ncbi:MAG: putative amino acid permease [Marmoricola sp.]|nr:putative amino acid permease [Marmoricola sp.]
MTSTQTAAKSPSGHSLKRELGIVGLLFASVGSIIGSGWLFGALTAAQETGPAAIISWCIGAVMVMLIGLVYAELGSMFPIAGGVVRFPHLAFGSFASFTSGWITWVAAATTAPIEVEGALQYATKYADFTKAHTVGGETVHTLTALGYGAAVVLLAFFVVVNYIGISWFARINNVLVGWKLVMIVLVIVTFLVTAFHGSNFHEYGFITHGWKGVFSAVATSGIVFSYLGFRQAIELAGEGSNPKRNIPLAVVGSILITAVLYILLQIAFIGSVRPEDLMSSHGWSKLDFANSFGPLAAIASLIGVGWLATLLYIDAFISPGDTGLIYTTTSARMTYAMARNGNAPSGLARTTSRGAPLISLVLGFVVGLIVLLPFPSWQQLVGFITSATVLSFGSGPLVLAALRRRLPDQERTFRLPGGDLIPILGFWSSNLIVYWTGWDIDWKLFVTVLLGWALLVLHENISKETAPLDFLTGLWVPVWLVLLATLSFIGDFGGGKGWVGFWPAIGLAALLSVGVFYWAVHLALPADRINEHIVEAERDSDEEEAAFSDAG